MLAEETAAKPQPPARAAFAPSKEVIARLLDEITSAIAAGFTRIDDRRPAILHHKSGDNIVPLRVSLPVWFAVRMAGETP